MTDAETPAETGHDDESTVHDPGGTPGPAVSRRDVMRGLAATGAAAALPMSVSAEHGADNPIDVSNDPTVGDDAFVDTVARRAKGGALAGAALAGPLGVVAGASVGGTIAGASAAGEFLFGSYQDRVDTQLQADLYTHHETVENELVWNIKQFDNRLDLAQNNWIAQAQFEVINAINDEKAEKYVVDAGVNAILEAATPAQKSLLAIEESVLLRTASFDAREEAAGVGDSAKATHFANTTNVISGVSPAHINLLNGETQETWVVTSDAGDVTHTHVKIGNGSGDVPTAIPSSAVPTMQEAGGGGADADTYTRPDDGSEFVFKSFRNSIGVIDPETGYLERYVVPLLRNSFWHSYYLNEFYSLVGTLVNEIETYSKDVYAAVQAGEISTDDLITPSVFAEELARDWSETGDTGLSRELLANLGVDTDLDTSMTIQVADQFSPGTVVKPADRGVKDTYDISLANAAATVTVGVDYGDDAALDGSGGVIVPGDGSPTLQVSADAFTDDPSSPSYVVQEVALTNSAGTTATARVADDGSGTRAIGEVWHDDLGGGAYTLSTVEVTYKASDGTEYTETVASPGTAIDTNPSGVAFEYQDCALSTDWRPFGTSPENWSETIKQVDSFQGVSMTETSTSVDVQASYVHDGDTTGADTYTVPSDKAIKFAAVSGNTADVTGVTLSLANQTADVTATVTSGSASIPHADLVPGDGTGEFTVQDVTIEYNDGAGGTATTVAGTLGSTLISEQITIPEYDFLVGKWYDGSSKGADDTITIVTGSGEWLDIASGDFFKITGATDVDGNPLDGVTLSDTNRHTLDPTRVEKEIQQSIELQKKTSGGGAGTGGGGGGGSGSGVSLEMLGVGGGALGALYLWARSQAGQ